MAISATGSHDVVAFCGRTFDVTRGATGIAAISQVAPASAAASWSPGRPVTPQIGAVLAAYAGRAGTIDITA